MKNEWIKHPTILDGEAVKLTPLEKESFDELFAASADPNIWEFTPFDCSKRQTFEKHYRLALLEREKGSQYPFIIRHKKSGKIIGSTRFLEIFPDDQKLEIGWTWIAREFWGTQINFECKLLLLTFCFEILQARRVQLKTDERNLRSRKAIEKIGAKFEGILRKDKIKENGISRNSVYYSILDEEWETAKQQLVDQIMSRQLVV